MIHSLSDCKAVVPASTNVWQYCVVMPNAQIGENCNICANVVIENDVRIGDNVTIKFGVEVCDGVTLEDNVFLGPNVVFVNDLWPRSKNPNWALKNTIIKKGASIGAGCAILCGITIGEKAMIGLGSVVTHDVPAGELWYGNPAKFIRKIDN